MTEDTLNRIEALANAATPGPWLWAGTHGDEWTIGQNSLTSPNAESEVLYGSGYDASRIEAKDEDERFIAHSRDLVPLLLNVARAAQPFAPKTMTIKNDEAALAGAFAILDRYVNEHLPAQP
jgi:hypothetical protein